MLARPPSTQGQVIDQPLSRPVSGLVCALRPCYRTLPLLPTSPARQARGLIAQPRNRQPTSGWTAAWRAGGAAVVANQAGAGGVGVAQRPPVPGSAQSTFIPDSFALQPVSHRPLSAFPNPPNPPTPTPCCSPWPTIPPRLPPRRTVRSLTRPRPMRVALRWTLRYDRPPACPAADDRTTRPPADS
jgi:hypothetical protein